MKRLLKVIVGSLACILVALVLYVLITFPPIMAGMAAKVMCSCVYLTGRTPESVVRKELQVFPGLSKLRLDINAQDSSVAAHLFWQTSKAIYRKGLGCTLLAEADETTVRMQKLRTQPWNREAQDSVQWPTGDLNAVTVENPGRAAIERVVAKAFIDKDPESPVNTHAVVIVYNGKIISEKYAKGFDHHSVLMGWSMTKSITNALIGILVGDGKLNVEDPAPVMEWRNDERKKITLNHLLQASSGLSWSESYFLPGADFHNMFIRSDDKAGYAISRELSHLPGTYFQYSSGTTNILSRIIRQTVGDDDYYRFPYERLFSRIGMHHAVIEADASGTFVASSYGYASARDWARLGLLYLNDGLWQGERILPEGWVKYSTTPAPAAMMREYGAQIWLNLGMESNPERVKFPGLPHEAIIFSGFEDNYVVIVPSKNLVVVRLGVTHNDLFDIGRLVTEVADLVPDRENVAHTASSW